MPIARMRRPSRAEPPHDGAGPEWAGGILTPPFFVTDRDDPYRPPLVIWCEAPSGVIVGHSLVAPEDLPGALGRGLLAAMAQPLIGEPRRPGRIRVANVALVGEVREAIGGAVPVEVAPTPELDEVLEFMLAQADSGEAAASYLEDGRVSPATVAQLFRAAEILFRLAPWTVAADNQVLRMDIPALGVEGACLSVIGNLGESLGLLVFPSLEAFDAFAMAGEEAERRGSRPDAGTAWDLGTGWLALSFDRGAELPDSMRQEIERHGWPVVGPEALPASPALRA